MFMHLKPLIVLLCSHVVVYCMLIYVSNCAYPSVGELKFQNTQVESTILDTPFILSPFVSVSNCGCYITITDEI